MKLFILLVCLLVVATQAMPHHEPGMPDYGSGYPDYGSGMPDYGSSYPDYGSGMPDYGSGMPDYGPEPGHMPFFEKHLNATERQAIREEFLKVGHGLIMKCAANNTNNFVCMIIHEQMRMCNMSKGPARRQMGPPGMGPPEHMKIQCDLFKAVRDNNKVAFEAAFGKMQDVLFDGLSNSIHHGMKFMIDHVKGGHFDNDYDAEMAGKEVEEEMEALEWDE